MNIGDCLNSDDESESNNQSDPDYEVSHDEDEQLENMLEFRNIQNKIETVELSEFMGPSGEDDSNASDDDFINDKTYQQEFDEQELEDIKHLANNQGPGPEDLNLEK